MAAAGLFFQCGSSMSSAALEERVMVHFPEEDWVRLVRSIRPETGREDEMRAHLDSCEDCRMTHELVKTVTEAAKQRRDRKR